MTKYMNKKIENKKKKKYNFDLKVTELIRRQLKIEKYHLF